MKMLDPQFSSFLPLIKHTVFVKGNMFFKRQRRIRQNLEYFSVFISGIGNIHHLRCVFSKVGKNMCDVQIQDLKLRIQLFFAVDFVKMNFFFGVDLFLWGSSVGNLSFMIVVLFAVVTLILSL